MKYRYIYKITCTAGSFKGKFYFGQHTTTNLDDGYKGSGRKINDYYKKYPNDYIKEIIAFYNSEEELNKAEYDIILPWLNNEMCLNLCGGGKVKIPSEETRKLLANGRKGKTNSYESNVKRSKALKGRSKPPFSDEHKKKLSDVHKDRAPYNKGLIGQYKWITNNKEQKFIKIEELEYYLKLGYHLGRK